MKIIYNFNFISISVNGLKNKLVSEGGTESTGNRGARWSQRKQLLGTAHSRNGNLPAQETRVSCYGKAIFDTRCIFVKYI